MDSSDNHPRNPSQVTIQTLRPSSNPDVTQNNVQDVNIKVESLDPPMMDSPLPSMTDLPPSPTPKPYYSLPRSIANSEGTSEMGTYPRPKKDPKYDTLGRSSAKLAQTLNRAPAPVQTVARPVVRRMYVDEPNLFWSRIGFIILLTLAAMAIIGYSIYQWVTAPPLIKSSYTTQLIYPPQVIACFDKVYYNLDAMPMTPMVMLGYANMSMIDFKDISIKPAKVGVDFGLTQIGNEEFAADEYQCWRIRLAGMLNGEKVRFSANGVTFIDVSLEAEVPVTSPSYKATPIMNPIKIALTEEADYVPAAMFRAIAADKMTPIVYEEEHHIARNGKLTVDYVPKPTYNQQDAPPMVKVINGVEHLIRMSSVWFCLDNMHNSPDPDVFNVNVFTEVPSYDFMNFFTVLGATLTWAFILYRLFFGSLRMDPFGLVQRYFIRGSLRNHVDDTYGGFVAVPPAVPDMYQQSLGVDERVARLEKLTRVLADLYLETDLVVDEPGAYTYEQAQERRMATMKEASIIDMNQ